MNEKVYSIREVARILGVCKDTVRKRINNGLIKAHKDGSHWRITQTELSRLIYGGCDMDARDACERSFKNGEAAGRESAFKEACEIVASYRRDIYEPQLPHAVGVVLSELEVRISTCRMVERLIAQQLEGWGG